ncbi:MAG: UbiX family flavin prenyltransferase [Bacteroidales bacterium]
MENPGRNNTPINLLVAVTGASGAIYAQRLLKKLESLRSEVERVAVVFSKSGEDVWRHELGSDPDQLPFARYQNNDFFTPPASGSGKFNTMIIIPCTMGTMASVAQGLADDLIARAADVMLKERKKLIIVPREMPFNLIHIRNMEQITLAGGIICPAIPSFYHKPESLEDVVDSVVNKVLQLAGFHIAAFAWGESPEESR